MMKTQTEKQTLNYWRPGDLLDEKGREQRSTPQPGVVYPDLILSSGRKVVHSRMSNDAQSAEIEGDMPEMTEQEWEEYCDLRKVGASK